MFATLSICSVICLLWWKMQKNVFHILTWMCKHCQKHIENLVLLSIFRLNLIFPNRPIAFKKCSFCYFLSEFFLLCVSIWMVTDRLLWHELILIFEETLFIISDYLISVCRFSVFLWNLFSIDFWYELI